MLKRRRLQLSRDEMEGLIEDGCAGDKIELCEPILDDEATTDAIDSILRKFTVT
jgi:hypothetical protein